MERLRAILNTAVDAIITIDHAGIITELNNATLRMFGYKHGELIGQNVSVLMPSPYQERHNGYLATYLRTGEKKIIGQGREVLGRRKDGTLFPADLAVTEVVGFNQFTGIVRDITERKELQRGVTSAHDEERGRLARELHDGVAGHMTGIGLIAKMLQGRLEKAAMPEAKEMANLVGYIREAHEELRQISHELMPTQIQPDRLIPALNDLAHHSDAVSSPLCVFQCSSPVYLLSAEVSTHLWRIAQEAVSNALRHAKAYKVTIQLVERPNSVVLTVEDDGVGIQETSDYHEGLGLNNMSYRAGLIGALLAITATASGGTIVRCTLPVERNENDEKNVN
jgi:two-component system CheB/CheR fusion protein